MKKVLLSIASLVLIALVLLILSYKNIIEHMVILEAAEYRVPLKFQIESLNGEGAKLKDIQIGEKNRIDYLNINYDIRPHFNINSIELKIAQYDLEELKSYVPEDTNKAEEPSKAVSFEHCDKIEDLKFKLELPSFEAFNLSFKCNNKQITSILDSFSYKDLGPFQIKVESDISNDPIKSNFVVGVGNPSAEVAVGKLDYFQSGDFKLVLDRQKKSLDLEKLIAHLAPNEYRDKIESSSGKLKFFGKVEGGNHKLGLNFDIEAENINFQMSEYSVKKAKLKHSVIEYPSMKSRKRQTFEAREISIGPVIHNLKLVYDVESKDKVNVSSFAANFEGTEIKVGPFSLYPVKKKFTPAQINLNKVDLQKFLRLALGETTTAKGELEGKLKVSFENNKPIIEDGELKAKGPGTIQYRPPTSKKPDPNSYSADPVEILNAYLWDFHYKTLSVTISSDINYDMKMVLTALGNNPGYLNGKALKLKVNLEQNLLAAFQAMMLSYNLPKNLEKRIQKMGN